MLHLYPFHHLFLVCLWKEFSENGFSLKKFFEIKTTKYHASKSELSAFHIFLSYATEQNIYVGIISQQKFYILLKEIKKNRV